MPKLLPTPLELRALPPRVLVAFAVRCCRRIQPLYDLPHDQPHPASLEPPLCAAEAFARSDGPADPGEAARLMIVLAHAANAAHYAAHAWSCVEPWQHHHRNDPAAASAATYAEAEAHDHRQRASYEALEANRELTEPVANAADLATLVAQIARTATHVTATHVAVKSRPAVAADFEKLRALCVPVPPEALEPSESGPLGALWPAGEPAWAAVKE